MGQIGSTRTLGTRLALAALALGIGAAAVGCSTGSGAKKVALRSVSGAPPGASAGGAGGTTVPGGTATSAPTAGATSDTAAAPGTTAGHPGATTGTTKGSGGSTGTSPPATTPRVTTAPSSGPVPAAPGTYHYNLVSGTSSLTTGTTIMPLTVAPQSTLVVSSTGSGTQQWVNSSTTVNVAFTGAGVYLLAETIPLASTTCTFNAPVASPPWPLAVGKSFSGQATCGSGSSASSLSLQGRVSGTASVVVGGASVATFLVQSTVTLPGTTLVIAETDWYAPSLRLPVKSTVIAKGGVTGYLIDSNTTYTLASSLPS